MRRYKYTESERRQYANQFIRLRSEGVSPHAAATRLGVHYWTLMSWCRRFYPEVVLPVHKKKDANAPKDEFERYCTLMGCEPRWFEEHEIK